MSQNTLFYNIHKRRIFIIHIIGKIWKINLISSAFAYNCKRKQCILPEEKQRNGCEETPRTYKCMLDGVNNFLQECCG